MACLVDGNREVGEESGNEVAAVEKRASFIFQLSPASSQEVRAALSRRIFG